MAVSISEKIAWALPLCRLTLCVEESGVSIFPADDAAGGRLNVLLF